MGARIGLVPNNSCAQRVAGESAVPRALEADFRRRAARLGRAELITLIIYARGRPELLGPADQVAAALGGVPSWGPDLKLGCALSGRPKGNGNCSPKLERSKLVAVVSGSGQAVKLANCAGLKFLEPTKN